MLFISAGLVLISSANNKNLLLRGFFCRAFTLRDPGHANEMFFNYLTEKSVCKYILKATFVLLITYHLN